MAKRGGGKAPKGGMLPPLKDLDQPSAPVRRGKYDGRRGVARVDNRATGWRLPLIVSACLIVVFAAIYGVQQLTQEKLIPIDPSLVAIAASWKIDLDADPVGHRLKEEMGTVATGFKSTETKDARLADMGRIALASDRIDVACVATAFMHRTTHHGELLQDIHYKAVQDCATMPWSVFAIRNLADQPDGRSLANQLTSDLNTRWEACGRSLGNNYQPGGRLPGTGTGAQDQTGASGD